MHNDLHTHCQVIDRLLTRLGSSDCMETSSSSFMVEMQARPDDHLGGLYSRSSRLKRSACLLKPVLAGLVAQTYRMQPAMKGRVGNMLLLPGARAMLSGHS